jgi:hypothetical protein
MTWVLIFVSSISSMRHDNLTYEQCQQHKQRIIEYREQNKHNVVLQNSAVACIRDDSGDYK